jgi:hypothetical protein
MQHSISNESVNSLIDSSDALPAPRPLLAGESDSKLQDSLLSNQILIPVKAAIPKSEPDFESLQIDPSYMVEPFAVRAEYMFTAELEDEVSFNEGEYLTVYATGGRLNSGEGWWFGGVSGQFGWFPAAYTQLHNPETV